jgi:hypothetical protein
VDPERTYEIPVPEGLTAEDVLDRARGEARAAGVALHGDGSGGRFEGMASGSWTVDGRTLRVRVTQKPAMIPWGMVESVVRRLFG